MSDSSGVGAGPDDVLSGMSFGPLDAFLATFFAAGGIGWGTGGTKNDVVELSLRAVASVLVFSLLLRIRRKVRPLPLDPSLPGPPTRPLLGIVPYVLERWSDWPAETLRLSRKFGWRTWGGPAPNFGGSPGAWIQICDERNLRHVLSDNFGNYVKTVEDSGVGLRHLYHELLGEGIFAADGERWVTHRKVASNMFSRNLLRHTAKVTLGKLREIAGLFRDALPGTDDGDGESSASFDIQDLFYRMTFDTTSLVAFGCEFNSIRGERQHAFAVAFDEMQQLIVDRTLDPFFPLKRSLRIGRRERRIRRLKTVLDSHAANFIQSKRRTAADERSELGPDLLSRFLAHSEKTGAPMSNEELRDVVMNILIAGRDTTACALSWTFWELSKHPEIVKKIIAEVDEICGRVSDDDDEAGGDDAENDANHDYSYDAVSRLRYTHAVVLEALRLHPSVTNDHKYAVQDDVLPDGTFVPAGTGVAYLPYAMGRSEKIWGEGASEFLPERFLGEDAEEGEGRGRSSREPSQFRYPVFNAGPRLCLGKPLALTTIKLTLAYLLPRFDFADEKGHDGSYRWTLVRAMKNGFEVEVSRRGFLSH